MKLMILFYVLLLFVSCRNGKSQPEFEKSEVDLSRHKITGYSFTKGSKYLIVLEPGLGDDHTVWEKKGVAKACGKLADVFMYDRSGYGKSEKGSLPRDIDKLSNELDSVLEGISHDKKVILIGHSLGGMIIRAYAIKHPAKTAGLLFVDPAHEYYHQPTQEVEDYFYDFLNGPNGPEFGGTMEARELMEDSKYMSTLSDLPNIPVMVLTSMRTDSIHTPEERQLWHRAHEKLGKGVNDFTHSTTKKSGHYIMQDEPDWFMERLKHLFSRLD